MRKITQLFVWDSSSLSTPIGFQEFDHIETTMLLINLIWNDFPEVFNVIRYRFLILILSSGSSVHPFLIAGEVHSEFALDGCDLVFEAMLVLIKDSDTTIAGLVAIGGLDNFMSWWCRILAFFKLFSPDITLNRVTFFRIGFGRTADGGTSCCSNSAQTSISRSYCSLYYRTTSNRCCKYC